MPEIVSRDKEINSMRTLLGTMGNTLRLYWNQSESYQKFAYVSAFILLASSIFHMFVFLVEGGSLAGPISWRKPILFGESFGLTVLFVAWFISFLPMRRLFGWLLMGIMSIAALIEVFLITMQQWRGVPSHFNFSSLFDERVFNIMGTVVIFVELVIIVVTIWSLFSLKAPKSLSLAIKFGLVLLLVSQIFGNMIIANGLAKVFDFETGQFISENVSTANIYGDAGQMKLPHALMLHAAQVLPLLAWLLLFTPWKESRRTQVVLTAIVGYVGLTTVMVLQMYSGLVPYAIGGASALILSLCILLVVIAYLWALVGLGKAISN